MKHCVFGETRCWIYSVEWQKRGLPHAHILIWLVEKIRPNEVDEVISAEIPNEQVDPGLHELPQSKAELIQKVFPNVAQNYLFHNWLSERAILAAKNTDVNELDFKIQDDMPGEISTYKSVDTATNEANDNIRLALILIRGHSTVRTARSGRIHYTELSHVIHFNASSMFVVRSHFRSGVSAGAARLPACCDGASVLHTNQIKIES
ncbi:hypothetical protein EVAR_51499_1 [Eumeta japonica]|uniref:Helitron helicase-like domain-containing protein n=1 Tax=Eumeta variegata TaxID=151549 RepID=A0A4C1XAV4_EUMVA|nr:hypothetical protein EVAR_51499_1 [Eumeta japonica]